MKWFTISLSIFNGVISYLNPYLIGTSFFIYFGINLLRVFFENRLERIETMTYNWKRKVSKAHAFDLAFVKEEDNEIGTSVSGKFLIIIPGQKSMKYIFFLLCLSV